MTQRLPRLVPRNNPFIDLPGSIRVMYLGFQAAYLVLMIVAIATDDGAGGDRYAMAGAVTLGSLAAGLPIVFAPRSMGWFHPLIFPALYGMIYQLRAFPIYAYGFEFHYALPGMSPADLNGLMTFGLILSVVASLSYFAGFFLCPTAPIPVVSYGERKGLSTRVMLVVVGTALLFLVFIGSRGGLAGHFASWYSGRAVSLSGAYYWVLAMRTASVAVVVWLAYRPSVFRNPLFWAATVMASMMAFMMTGSRSSILFYTIVGAIVWMLSQKKVPIARLALLAVVFILVLGSLGSLRNRLRGASVTTDQRSLVETWERSVSEIRERSGSLRGDLAIYGNVPDHEGYLFGASYLSLVTLPIPRGIWKDKPMVIEAVVGRRFFRVNAGVPPGGVAEAFWNFHIPGVVAVYFIFGGFMRWVATSYQRNRPVPAVIVVYAYTLFVLTPTGTSIVGWLMGLVPMAFVLVIVGQYRIRWGGVVSVRRNRPAMVTT